jgi:hypothetical protein
MADTRCAVLPVRLIGGVSLPRTRLPKPLGTHA